MASGYNWFKLEHEQWAMRAWKQSKKWTGHDNGSSATVISQSNDQTNDAKVAKNTVNLGEINASF
jgi:hypothetical protein